MIEKGCGGEGAQAWGSPCVEFQELKEEEEGVFSFFLVYLMAEEGGLSLQRFVSARDLFGVPWRATPGRAAFLQGKGRESSGGSLCLHSRVCPGECGHDTHKCMPAVFSPHASRSVCATTCVYGRYRTD